MGTPSVDTNGACAARRKCRDVAATRAALFLRATLHLQTGSPAGRLPGLIVDDRLVEEPGFGRRSAACPARQYPEHAHLATQGDRQDITLLHGVAGLDHPYPVHPNLATLYQLGRRGAALEYPGKPEPPVEALGKR